MKKFIIYVFSFLFFVTNVVYAEQIKTWDPINVYSNSNESSSIIDILERGEYVVVIDRVNGFTNVKYVANMAYKYGWVKDEFVTNEGVIKYSPWARVYYRDKEILEKSIDDKYKPYYLTIKGERDECMKSISQELSDCELKYRAEKQDLDKRKNGYLDDYLQQERRILNTLQNTSPKLTYCESKSHCELTYRAAKQELDKRKNEELQVEIHLLDKKHDRRNWGTPHAINVRIVN